MKHSIEISSLVYGGSGLGRLPNGKAVFVPFVFPGESVQINVKEEKKHFVHAELITIEEPSDHRITPRCKHFGHCGGCHYQHIPYHYQLTYKRDIFIEQMERIGGITELNIGKTIACAHEWNYRNSLQFHLLSNGSLAFMDKAKADPFKVEECHLPMGEIAKVWPLFSFDNNNGIGRIEIRQNELDEALVILEGNQASIPSIEISSSLSTIHSIGTNQVVISGNDHLIISLKGKTFRVSAGSFFQTNFFGTSALVDTVLEMLKGLGGTLMDLYCGVGLFSAFLADRFSRIVAVESSPSACEDFAINLDSYDHITLYEGTVERTLSDINQSPDCVIVDPPRNGMNRFAVDAIIEKAPPMIIYVSCNPSTLARDLKRLAKGGYRLDQSILVDMFPQTYHIESVNVITRS